MPDSARMRVVTNGVMRNRTAKVSASQDCHACLVEEKRKQQNTKRQSPIQPFDTTSVRRAVVDCGGSRPRDGSALLKTAPKCRLPVQPKKETESYESSNRLFVKIGKPRNTTPPDRFR